MNKIKSKVKKLKLKDLAKGLAAHPLFSGRAIMILGSNLANFVAYLYHLVIGRLLGPSSYGELSAVISFLGLILVSLNFLGLVIVKFVSSAQEGERAIIYKWISVLANRLGIILAIVFLVTTPFFSNFLHIDYLTFMLITPILGLSVPSFVYRSFLQGMMKFREVVTTTNLDFISRLILGIFFVYFGLETFGAILGIVFSTLFSFFLLRHYLSSYRYSTNGEKFKNSKALLKYAAPIFLATVGTNSIFSTDVVLVKHFFTPHDAGIYASLSTLGKIIFFGAGPISAVMFPLVSQRFSHGGAYRKIFILSFIMALTICLGVLLVYWLFPKISIRLLFGSDYLEGSTYLVWFGIFMTFFTLGSLILNFYLSIEKTKTAFIIAIVALMQAVGIWLFHDTILTVIKVSIIASFLFLGSMILYFWNGTRASTSKE
jgi:O-antigen/teichoic acid export membrane protein